MCAYMVDINNKITKGIKMPYLMVEVNFDATELFNDSASDKADKFSEFLAKHNTKAEFFMPENDIEKLKDKFHEQARKDNHRYIWVKFPEGEEAIDKFNDEIDEHPYVTGLFAFPEKRELSPKALK
jgi:hypothetical protein